MTTEDIEAIIEEFLDAPDTCEAAARLVAAARQERDGFKRQWEEASRALLDRGVVLQHERDVARRECDIAQERVRKLVERDVLRGGNAP